jgi:hypothetical protein
MTLLASTIKTVLNKRILLTRRSISANFKASPNGDSEKNFSRRKRLSLGGKTKGVLTFAIVVALLISFLVSASYQSPQLSRWLGIDFVQPTQDRNTGLILAGQPVNSSVWLKVAADAWAYFQPGVGVDAKTGLPYASGTNFEAFTEWDLGTYIQAVIDAQKLGLISTEGPWGSSVRLQKVVDFLENRPLNASTGYPFWFYDATNGQDCHSMSDKATEVVDGADMGRLFVALNNLRVYNASLAPSIDYIVYNQSNYAALLPGIEEGAASDSVYAYLIYSGYACFWSQQVGNVPNDVVANIAEAQNIKTYGISLPDVPITCDPLLFSVFEPGNCNPQLSSLMKQVYLAHEAYYDATGKYVAFCEGNSFTSQYLYEWVVAPNGQAWKIGSTVPNKYLNMDPILYTKAAFGFLALYNSTFSQNLVAYMLKMLPDPSARGFCDGADSSGRCTPGTGCDTNGLILDTALYAVDNS